MRFGTELLKRGFAKMQKGGVVMDVTNAEQAAIAEEAGSVAVMASSGCLRTSERPAVSRGWRTRSRSRRSWTPSRCL